MRLGVLAGLDAADWQDSLAKVRIAEDLGYELVGRGEAWGTSVLPWLTLLAANTEKIKLGPSILNCFSRSPAAMAQEIGLLDQISGGRMVMGLGSSGAQVIEHFHGVPFERPLQRLREYTEIFNLLIAGEALNYEGEIFTLERGFKLDYPRPRNKIPVYIAAITPKSIVQTGEIADGIYPIHWPKGRFASLRRQLDDAATAAGREAGCVTIAPNTSVHVTDGRNDEAQWQAARAPLHFYVNRMGTFYWQMLAREGFAAEVRLPATPGPSATRPAPSPPSATRWCARSRSSAPSSRCASNCRSAPPWARTCRWCRCPPATRRRSAPTWSRCCAS